MNKKQTKKQRTAERPKKRQKKKQTYNINNALGLGGMLYPKAYHHGATLCNTVISNLHNSLSSI